MNRQDKFAFNRAFICPDIRSSGSNKKREDLVFVNKENKKTSSDKENKFPVKQNPAMSRKSPHQARVVQNWNQYPGRNKEYSFISNHKPKSPARVEKFPVKTPKASDLHHPQPNKINELRKSLEDLKSYEAKILVSTHDLNKSSQSLINRAVSKIIKIRFRKFNFWSILGHIEVEFSTSSCDLQKSS